VSQIIFALPFASKSVPSQGVFFKGASTTYAVYSATVFAIYMVGKTIY